MMPTFDMDERLFDPEHAMPGLLTIAQVRDLEEEWKAALIDVWCTVTALTAAANRLRTIAGLPANARFGYVLNTAFNLALDGDQRAARAVQAYRDAEIAYRNANFVKDDVRRRAHAA